MAIPLTSMLRKIGLFEVLTLRVVGVDNNEVVNSSIDITNKNLLKF